MAKTTRRRPLTPKRHIDQTLELLKEVDSAYRVLATEIPRDTYALLVFGLAGACKIERTSESKFTVSSSKAPGKRVTVTDESKFRKTFNQMWKSLEPSPDRRKDFMTSMEQYAEACLSVADAHSETEGFLPLEADSLVSTDTPDKDESSVKHVESYFTPQQDSSTTEIESIKAVTNADGSVEYFCMTCDEVLQEESLIDSHLTGHLVGKPGVDEGVPGVRAPKGVFDTPPSPMKPVSSSAEEWRKIVKVEPFQAKHYQTKDHGIKRESELINVVTYDDGSIAYKCRVCDEYTSENQRSLNGHMGKHSREEREKAKGKPVLHRTEKWVPTPNQKSRIVRLANEIANAMELGLTSPEAIASAIIESRALDSSNRDDHDEPEVVDMTPAQQIEAIRRILGADQAVKEVRDEQEKVITGLQDQIDSMRMEMDNLRQQETTAKKELSDFREWYVSMPLKR